MYSLAGEYCNAIETLVTALSVIEYSNLENEDKRRILISIIHDALREVQTKSSRHEVRQPLKWVTEKSIEKSLEVTGVELTGEKRIVIIELYRSPSGKLQEFLLL